MSSNHATPLGVAILTSAVQTQQYLGKILAFTGIVHRSHRGVHVVHVRGSLQHVGAPV